MAGTADPPLIEVTVAQVCPHHSVDRPLLWLCEKEATRPRLLPIAIGQFEALSIAMRLHSQEPTRPVSYDLIAALLGQLSVTVRQVVVTRVQQSIFYAKIVIEKDLEIRDLDARPSDAIALALRTGSALFVSRELLEQAGLPPLEEGTQVEEAIAQFNELDRPSAERDLPTAVMPPPLSPIERADELVLEEVGQNPAPQPQSADYVDQVLADELPLLRNKLEQAVLLEEYEEAAQLRDKIELLVNKSRT
ncbi:MAG: hypothetical protein GKR89_31095 [Candidatus Latescibacteria bacterium]|nr:hypothetical protein [Candidatus Latescibacterota bacterium]